jgi:2-C-methyl-D-erythritol 4-phosphate cytidylyltransferase
VTGTIPREELMAVQTPQAFRADRLRAAHAGDPEGTDDAAVVERAGGRVVVVAGAAHNFKITEPADLDRAAEILARRAAVR